MKSAIFYVSVHHGNTKEVVTAMAEVLQADLLDLTQVKEADLSGYDLVGLASGCYFQKMHRRVLEFAGSAPFLPEQKIFLVCTCGMPLMDYTAGAKKLLRRRGVSVSGSFQCRGHDTYGPFQKIGGIAKGHPGEKDLKRAAAFAQKLQTH